MLEKTLESPLDCKEIQPVHCKGDQSWVFIGRTDAKAETPILWPPHAKSWLIGEGPDAGRDSGQEEKGTTEDEMAGWHHRLEEHEFEWTPELVMNWETCHAAIQRVAKSQAWLSGWTKLNLTGMISYSGMRKRKAITRKLNWYLKIKTTLYNILWRSLEKEILSCLVRPSEDYMYLFIRFFKK